MSTNRFLSSGTMALCGVAAIAAAGHQQPTFRGGRDAVRVFVTVTDRDGRLATKLAKDNFEVRDDGKPQPITYFDNSPQPVRLIVMLDVSGSMEGNLALLRASAGQLFTRMAAEDVARVGTFGREVTISPSFTRDANELRAALPSRIDPEAPTPLWRAIDQAMDALGDAPLADDRRKVILVLSDGKDTGATGPLSFRTRPASQAEVIDRARRDDVMIYGIGMRSRGRQQMPGGPPDLRSMMLADMPDPGLARVSEETGGGYAEIRQGEDLGYAFEGVLDELHTQYLLAFAPPKRDGKVHDISVRITPGPVKARARKSYVAPKD
jgi:Ca-activated chloride channel family protein